METLILASASPRRRELLTRIGLSFEAVPTEVDEWTDLPAGEAVTELSRRKAEAREFYSYRIANKPQSLDRPYFFAKFSLFFCCLVLCVLSICGIMVLYYIRRCCV